ncbi:NAD-dependent epimerase/dehydratase family protein [Catelliglobosispora koreensis]|uniref:NAD-dependent epimerase/dehydratase family protein n=1 Tax=Catelliglobosispora koreensis TaxID=129052 RepID=UPI000360ADD1|nr:NAD(P)-dependent oxidoreductase [Catelliglobosispora koreensis]
MGLTIAVLGATGVYSRHLIPRLTAAGHRVLALARRPEAATVATACGAEVRQADIFNRDQLAAALEGCDIGVNLATSLPGPAGRGDFDANDQLRREGTPVWVAACRDAGVARIIQQSIAMVNSGAGDAWADEDTAPTIDDSPAGRAIAASLDMENAVRTSTADWAILRGGLFYGPGTGLDDDWFSRAAAGKLRLPGDGQRYVSLVHIQDMAMATLATIARWPSRQTLIVADDQPAKWLDVMGYVTASAGSPPAQPGGRLGFPSFRVRNARAREVLSWKPFYSSYHSGLAR